MSRVRIAIGSRRGIPATPIRPRFALWGSPAHAVEEQDAPSRPPGIHEPAPYSPARTGGVGTNRRTRRTSARGRLGRASSACRGGARDAAGLGSIRASRTRRPHRRGLARPGGLGAGTFPRHHRNRCREPHERERDSEGRRRQAHRNALQRQCLHRPRPKARARDRGVGSRNPRHPPLLGPVPRGRGAAASRHSGRRCHDAQRIDHAGRDQDNEQGVAIHPPLVHASDLVAAARARRRAHPCGVGTARRLRADRRRTPLRVGGPRRPRDRSPHPPG